MVMFTSRNQHRSDLPVGVPSAQSSFDLTNITSSVEDGSDLPVGVPSAQSSFDLTNITSSVEDGSDLDGVLLAQSSFDLTNITSGIQDGNDLPKGVPSAQASLDLTNLTQLAPLQPVVPLKLQRDRSTTSGMIVQQDFSPADPEILGDEVRGIYAGLVMVEAKCIEVDQKYTLSTEGGPKLHDDTWQALVALHRTLLHEHHDFFLASQHPSASTSLRRMVSKYNMLGRMWRYGIQAFLEVLRSHLKDSTEHMVGFIHIAYTMVAVLYETVPAFKDSWTEFLGDLARYRMAIEDTVSERVIWTNIAIQRYSEALNKAPTTGRIHYYLALLARTNVLQHLFYYSKSLCVKNPYKDSRESLLTLFDPVLRGDAGLCSLHPLERAFVKAHGLLFTRNTKKELLGVTVDAFLVLLRSHICITEDFKKEGAYVAITNSSAMLDFGLVTNLVMRAIAQDSGDNTTVETKDISTFRNAERLSNESLSIVLEKFGDPNVLPYIHVTMVYILYLSAFPNAMSCVQDNFPWNLLSATLDELLKEHELPLLEREIPFPKGNTPFPEDYFMRGLLWTENYFPDEWFDNTEGAREDYELCSMTEQRTERVLYLGIELSKHCPLISYTGKGFSALKN